MRTEHPPSTIRNCAPPLTAKLAPWMESLLDQPDTALRWVEEFGSPLHVVVQSEFERNAHELKSAFLERNLDGMLYFARKANKLPWFVSAAKHIGLGVDTASIAEVRETLALGVPSDRVIVTAIGKTKELITLCVAENCLLVVESYDELKLIRSVAASLGKRARIGLRFAGFITAQRKVYSRFGFPVNDAVAILDQVLASPNFTLEVLHAHIDRYDTEERACAGRQLIEIADLAQQRGNKIKAIDLGGGILIRYLQERRQWEEFQQALRDSVLEKRESFTFLNDGLGYVKFGDQLAGQPDLYPAWNSYSKERFIAAVLDSTASSGNGGLATGSHSGRPLHKEISERGLQLWFEPGRALLDNVGMTFARVAFRKHDTLGNFMVGLSMNRFNLRPFRAEFCSDPYVLSNGPRETANEGAFLVGCLCSESDTIFRRRIQLPVTPQAGDVIAFANSAGYLMHHLEVSTHGDPLPANILIEPETWTVKAELKAI